jgi:hypothetical protein
MKWTDYDRNELYKVTKGAHFESIQFEDLYKTGVFDTWKNGRTDVSLYQVVRRQNKGFAMQGVVRQSGVQINEPVVIQSQSRVVIQPVDRTNDGVGQMPQKRSSSGNTRTSDRAITLTQKGQKTQNAQKVQKAQMPNKKQKRDRSGDKGRSHKAMTPA